MKKLATLGLIFVSIIVLSSCNMINEGTVFNNIYCEENPNDTGCLTNGEPTGEIKDQTSDPNQTNNPDDPDGTDSCSQEGYVFNGTECVENLNNNGDACPDGYYPEAYTLVCVPLPNTCTGGEVFDTDLNACVLPTQTCPEGEVYDLVLLTCVVEDTCDGIWIGEDCVSYDGPSTCPIGYEEVINGHCSKINTGLNCNEFYIEDDGTCTRDLFVSDVNINPFQHKVDDGRTYYIFKSSFGVYKEFDEIYVYIYEYENAGSLLNAGSFIMYLVNSSDQVAVRWGTFVNGFPGDLFNLSEARDCSEQEQNWVFRYQDDGSLELEYKSWYVNEGEENEEFIKEVIGMFFTQTAGYIYNNEE